MVLYWTFLLPSPVCLAFTCFNQCFLKAQADKVVYTAQQYTPGCMHRRNRHLVDNSGVCVCYLTRNSGGTAYTVNYAKKQGVNVFNIAENIKL